MNDIHSIVMSGMPCKLMLNFDNNLSSSEGRFPGLFGGLSSFCCPCCGAKMLSMYRAEINDVLYPACVPYCFSCGFSHGHSKFRITQDQPAVAWLSFVDAPDKAMQSDWEKFKMNYIVEPQAASFRKLDRRVEDLIFSINKGLRISGEDKNYLASQVGHFAPKDLGGYAILDAFCKYSGHAFGHQRVESEKIRCSCGLMMRHFMSFANRTASFDESPIIVIPGSVVLSYKCPVHHEYTVFHQV